MGRRGCMEGSSQRRVNQWLETVSGIGWVDGSSPWFMEPAWIQSKLQSFGVKSFLFVLVALILMNTFDHTARSNRTINL